MEFRVPATIVAAAAAGIPTGDMQILAPPVAPDDGALVTVLPILLLAHIDVVEAKRGDWELDPKLYADGEY